MLDVRKQLIPYLGPGCYRLREEETSELAALLEKKGVSPRTFGKWIRVHYAPSTMMCVKGDPSKILNPFKDYVWEAFDKWMDAERDRARPKESARTQAAMSLILARGERKGVEDALSQGSDHLIIHRVLSAMASPAAVDYEEGARNILEECPWRNCFE
jgi:hypothetical protein